MDTDAELCAAAARATERLLRVPGVNGVGVGPKRAGGRAQGFGAIQVYVDHKRPLSEVDRADRIPVEIEGHPTNVATLTNRRYAALPDPAPGEWYGKRQPPPDIDTQFKDEVLAGGGPISGRVDETHRGTIGLLMEDVAGTNKKIYALTCYHVLCKLSSTGPDQTVVAGPVRDRTIVGQVDPNGSCSCSHCCDDGFGEFVQGEVFGHSWRDMALVRLRPGTKYIGGIKVLGPVAGLAPNPTVTEMDKDTYLVRKYGNVTGKTGGRVVSSVIDPGAGDPVAHYVVVPHIPKGAPPDSLHFAVEGDSGAAVVTPDTRVMGMLTGIGRYEAKEFFPNTDGFVNATLVAPLSAILIRFRQQLDPKFDVTPVLATSPTDIRTVPPNATALLDGEQVVVRMPSAAAVAQGLGEAARRPHEVRDRVRADLSASPFGQELVRLWLRHGPEVVDLVNHDRQVLTAWHRSGASAVHQRLARLPDTAALTTARFPGTVNDAPVADCVARMHAVLARRGSPELRAALDWLVPRLPDLAGLTYPQLLDVFDGTRV